MGLLENDLVRHKRTNGFRTFTKIARETPPDPAEPLRSALEQYAGAEQSMEKTASSEDLQRLWHLHEEAEKAYRQCVKVGHRKRADEILDRFPGWHYLKGSPSEPGDLTPLPDPE